MTQVLVTKPGVLSPADKRMLRKAGVVPIEAGAPEDVRLLQTEGPAIGGDDLLLAALQAMTEPAGGTLNGEHLARGVRAAFPAMVLKLLKARAAELAQ